MKPFKLIITLLVLFSLSFAQEGKIIGKIFPADQIEILFGVAEKSVSVQRTALESYLTQCKNYMMCGFINNQLVIADDNRKVLSPFSVQVANNNNSIPNNYFISEDDVLSVYSKCRVEELLSTAAADEVTFEMIGDVMVVTYGAYALEFAFPCPPSCP